MNGWLIAMDCDGTVDIAGPTAGTVGPPGLIPIGLVREIARDNIVYAIGNQALRNFVDIPSPYDNTGVPLGAKSRALDWIRSRHPYHELRLVVDDQPGQYAEGWHGWSFCAPADFAAFVRAETLG